MKTPYKMMIHEGRYAAEISYSEVEDGSPFGSHVSKEDAFKFDRVRLALRRGDVAEAAKDAKIFELHPVAAE